MILEATDKHERKEATTWPSHWDFVLNIWPATVRQARCLVGGVWGKPRTTSLSLSKSYSCPFGEDMTPGKQMPIVYHSPQRESRESNLPIIHQVFIPHLLSAGTVLNSVQLAGKESKLLPSWSLASVSRQVLQVMFHRLPQFMIMVMQ